VAPPRGRGGVRRASRATAAADRAAGRVEERALRRRLAQREFALLAVALLAGAIALAVAEKTRSTPSKLPAAYGSYPALAASSGTAAFGKRTACGTILHAKTEGVAHPVLPCGARIYVTYNGQHVLTQVIDHGPIPAGVQFELTDALARMIGLSGVQRIRWSYAAAR
jgi:rare lipoprotein A